MADLRFAFLRNGERCIVNLDRLEFAAPYKIASSKNEHTELCFTGYTEVFVICHPLSEIPNLPKAVPEN